MDSAIESAEDLIYEKTEEHITLNRLFNDDTGYVSITGKQGLDAKVLLYDNSYLPNINIENDSQLSLYLTQIQMNNGMAEQPEIRVNGGNIRFIYRRDTKSYHS